MKPVRICSTKRPINNTDDGRVEIANLTSPEVQAMEGVVNGQNWMAVQEGRLTFRDIFAPLPDPITDEKMLPFWRKAEDVKTHVQDELFTQDERSYTGESITIQSLCGYYYTPENYQKEAEKLNSYGFTQMRSKRGSDGRYVEMWYLPGVWAAQGVLKEIKEEIEFRARKWEDPLGERRHKEVFETILEYIRTHVQFGSLECSTQRMAMVIDD